MNWKEGINGMSTLALYGGVPAVKPIKPFNVIGDDDVKAVNDFMSLAVAGIMPMSGFLGGNLYGGQYVQLLENHWCASFQCRNAVAINSATSGLLAACQAVGVGRGDLVMVPAMTMSATAAAPVLLGANLYFGDIVPDTYCLDVDQEIPSGVKVVVVTNLFGHASQLRRWKEICDARGIWLIEDNAQAPFATEFDRNAGCVGDIGVFSLNVHKHMQCGEGGVCVTANDKLATHMRLFRNHGEMSGGDTGLNLRMTELTAAIAVSQLAKVTKVVASRIELARKLTAALSEFNGKGIHLPVVRRECRHVYYIYPIKIDKNRDWVVKALKAEGVPITAGYQMPLYRYQAFKRWERECPVSSKLHDTYLANIEMCAIDPTNEQIIQIGEAFKKVLYYEGERK